MYFYFMILLLRQPASKHVLKVKIYSLGNILF